MRADRFTRAGARCSCQAGNRFGKTAYHGASFGGGATGRRSRDLAGRSGTRCSWQLLGNRVCTFGLAGRGRSVAFRKTGRGRGAARGSGAERDAAGVSCAALATDGHQGGSLLPGDGRAFSRRYSGVAEYSGDEHGVFARRSGTRVAWANGNGSGVHGNTSARTADPSGGADWPADERSRGSENLRGEKRRPSPDGEACAR